MAHTRVTSSHTSFSPIQLPGVTTVKSDSSLTASTNSQVFDDPLRAPTPPRVPDRLSHPDRVRAEFRSKFADYVQDVADQLNREPAPKTLEGLKLLAKLHQWKEVQTLSSDILNGRIQSMAPLLPHVHVEVSLAFVTSCHKLRKYKPALDYINNIDWDSSAYRYETFPGMYPNMSGSFVPFAMRVLGALLPRYIGQPDISLRQSYLLLDEVNVRLATATDEIPNKVAELSAADYLLDPLINTATPNILSPKQELLHHHRMIAFVLIETHVINKQFDLAILVMRQVVAAQPDNPLLHQQFGRLLLQTSYLDLAQAMFAKAAALATAQHISNPVDEHINRGLILIAHNQFASALEQFNTALQHDPLHVHAANNKAICLLHLGRLPEAVDSLEKLLITSPYLVAHESLVQNICALYDLQSQNMQGKKEVIVELVKSIAPHSVDLSVLKIG